MSFTPTPRRLHGKRRYTTPGNIAKHAHPFGRPPPPGGRYPARLWSSNRDVHVEEECRVSQSGSIRRFLSPTKDPGRRSRPSSSPCLVRPFTPTIANSPRPLASPRWKRAVHDVTVQPPH